MKLSIINDFNYVRKYKHNGLKGVVATLLSLSFLSSMLFRLSNIFRKIVPVAKIFWVLNYFIFKVDIDYRATILGGVYMPHPLGIVVGKDVHVAGAIKIMQNVTIGGNINKTCEIDRVQVTQPHFLGKETIIGPSSIIIGPLVFKSCLLVAAGAVITRGQDNEVIIFGNNKSKEMKSEHKNIFKLSQV